jgi:hypothetical protein
MGLLLSTTHASYNAIAHYTKQAAKNHLIDRTLSEMHPEGREKHKSRLYS